MTTEALELVRPELFGALGDPLTLRRKIQIELDRRKFEKSLHEYTRAAWQWIEPGTPFLDNWHIGAISEHLQAAHARQIRNLVINMPPRHMKSTSVGVAWPTWAWTHDPGSKWLFSTYSGNLSIRDAVKSRRLLASPWYQQFWAERFSMTTDQNQKTRYENDKSGYRIATSVTGMATGEGGDFIVVDDPHNMVTAESTVQRKSVLEWWDQAMSTRLNDPKTGVRVLVMQRLHQKDLTGHVLEEQGWDHLILPAEYEAGTKRVTSIGWSDPRTTEGELLWPARYGPTELAKLKVSLGSYGAASQLQQRPVPREGGMIKAAWLSKRWRVLPARDGERREVVKVVQSWDTAKKANELNDYSVCTTWFVTATHYYLVDVFRRRLEFPELLRAVKSQFAKWSPTAVLIEDAASGTSLIQQLRSESLMPVLSIYPELAKEVRLEAVTPVIEAGRVVLPEDAEWLADLEGELTMFPAVEHDDQTDSVSQFLNWASAPTDVFIG